MAEKLGEIGEVFVCISESVKMAKQLRKKNLLMRRTVDEATKYAVDVETLQIHDKSLLDDLKKAAQKVRRSGSEFDARHKSYLEKAESFDKSVVSKFKKSESGSLSPESVTEFCEDLKKMAEVTKQFIIAFETFTQDLCDAQQHAIKLANKLKEMETKQQEEISTKWKRGLMAVGLSVGFVALGFFTGGAAWGAGAAAGASFFSAGVAGKTFFDIKKMRALAADILKDANSLEDVAKILKHCCDDAAKLVLSEKAMEHLETALQHYIREQEKNEALAEKDLMLAEKDTALAEKDTALAEKDMALAEKDTVLAEKDKALAEKDKALAEQEAKIREMEEKLKSN